MELSKEDSYEILELKPGAPFKDVIRQYKYLALEWFPDKHRRSITSLKKFQLISQALLTVSIPDFPQSRNLMSIEEMLSLFQFIFFGNESYEGGEEDEEGENDSGPEEDQYEEFYNDWSSENVELIREACKNLAADKDALMHNRVVDNGSSVASKSVTSVKDAVQNAKELILEEEREKRKAKKRRAQKKRRKERKRQEKNAQRKEHDDETKDSDDDEDDRDDDQECDQDMKLQKSKEESSSESEEEIDPESAFVAVIAKKKKKNIPYKKDLDAKSKNLSDADASLSAQLEEKSRVLRSCELAMCGNEMANSGHFQGAIKLFTEAIRLVPNDHRIYGNRSYCHDRLGNYERALSDAEKSIAIAPTVPKGYFRKGKALASLKRYSEAEKCFNEVLRLDEQCEDAVKELFHVKVSQIMDMGFAQEEAEHAIREHITVSAALDHLLPAAAAALSIGNEEEVFLSDEDDDYLNRYSKPQSSASSAGDPKMDPSNPEGYNSLWVGNLQPGVTEKIVLSLFSKYGEILSIKFTPERFFAFVNYKSKLSPGKAMRALQGAELFGKNLLIKYPNTKPSTATKAGSSQDPSKVKPFVVPVNGDECYFWRTFGCIHGNKCRYKHIKEHKGIDSKQMPSKF